MKHRLEIALVKHFKGRGSKTFEAPPAFTVSLPSTFPAETNVPMKEGGELLRIMRIKGYSGREISVYVQPNANNVTRSLYADKSALDRGRLVDGTKCSCCFRLTRKHDQFRTSRQSHLSSPAILRQMLVDAFPR
jgi:hypothetical protein